MEDDWVISKLREKVDTPRKAAALENIKILSKYKDEWMRRPWTKTLADLTNIRRNYMDIILESYTQPEVFEMTLRAPKGSKLDVETDQRVFDFNRSQL